MNLDDLADRIDTVGDAVAGTGSALRGADPGAGAFGGRAPGSFGELGRELHASWAAAIAARVREATAHHDRLVDLGYAVRQSRSGYQELERAARDRGTSAGEA